MAHSEQTQIHESSPLETLVLLELDSLRLEQERLEQVWPGLPPQPSSIGQKRFLASMSQMRDRSNRLERLLEAMSCCGFGESSVAAPAQSDPQLEKLAFLEAC